jgi:uncharacterized protein (DUF433 family)
MMSDRVRDLIASFDALPEQDKRDAAVEILRRVPRPAGDIPPTGSTALRASCSQPWMPRRPPEPAGDRSDAVWYSISMDPILSRITIDPAICHGKPCVRGLRYPVETLLELLSSGMTFDEILADYEDLERDDLLAALAYAARLARTRRSQPVGP